MNRILSFLYLSVHLFINVYIKSLYFIKNAFSRKRVFSPFFCFSEIVRGGANRRGEATRRVTFLQRAEDVCTFVPFPKHRHMRLICSCCVFAFPPLLGLLRIVLSNRACFAFPRDRTTADRA